MNSLNIDIDTELFYSGKYKLEAYCESNQLGSAWWDVYLVGADGKPDCQIGHFGKNVYFRTNAGINSRRYRKLGKMLKAIKETCKKNNVTVSEFRITTQNSEKYVIQ